MALKSVFYIRDEEGTLLGVADTLHEAQKRLVSSGIDGVIEPHKHFAPSQSPEKPKNLVWMGEKWVPVVPNAAGEAMAANIKTFWGDGRYWHRRYLQSHLLSGDTQHIFDTFVQDPDLGPISRVGIKSEHMLVDGKNVLLFSDFIKNSGVYRVGVQMNYDFCPDYYLFTENQYLALYYVLHFEETRLNFQKWLEECRRTFDILEEP